MSYVLVYMFHLNCLNALMSYLCSQVEITDILLLQLFYKYFDGSVKGELSHSPNQPYSRTKSGKKGKKKEKRK